MCGLYGIILTHPLEHEGELTRMVRLFNALAVSSGHRGQDATGVAILERDDVSYVYKNTLPAATIVDTQAWRNFFATFTSLRTAALLGHTRYGTHGQNVPENAHPFQFRHVSYGLLTGAHNGVVYNHNLLRAGYEGPYQNDSANLFWMLSQLPEHQFGELLETVYGSFALTFRRRNTIYLTRNASSPLYLSQIKGLPFLVYASEASILKVAADALDLPLSRPKSLTPHRLYGISLLSFRERVLEYAPNPMEELVVELGQYADQKGTKSKWISKFIGQLFS